MKKIINEHYRYETWEGLPYVLYKLVEYNDGTRKFYSNVIGKGWEEDPDVRKEFGMETDSHYCDPDNVDYYIELMKKRYQVDENKKVHLEF